MSPELTPAQLKLLLDRLSQVENEARALRAQIEERLRDRRQADRQDRSGQPRPAQKNKTR